MQISPSRILVATIAVVIVGAAWIPGLGAMAETKVDDGFKRALATFAAARALNAIVSVAQGTEFAAQPAGVGLNFTMGQVLDPINDLIEQFSTIMLMATAAFGVQKVLIGIGSWWPLSFAVSAAAIAWGASRWRHSPVPWLSRVLVGLLVLRFLVPVVTLGSEALFHHFMLGEYRVAQQNLELSATELGVLGSSAAAPSAPESILDKMKRLASAGADIGGRLEALKAAANQTVEHVVRLMVVFILQTVLLPLLLGWIFWRVARSLLVGQQASKSSMGHAHQGAPLTG